MQTYINLYLLGEATLNVLARRRAEAPGRRKHCSRASPATKQSATCSPSDAVQQNMFVGDNNFALTCVAVIDVDDPIGSRRTQ